MTHSIIKDLIIELLARADEKQLRIIYFFIMAMM
jgi:hypothetical protein